MAKSRFAGTVVVTGASSGIGLEIARLVAARATTLILIARRKDRLEDLKSKLVAEYKDLNVEVIARDLSDRAAATNLATELAARDGGVDVLVNNAGLGDRGLYELASIEKTLFMLDVNVTAVLLLTRALLPGMVARGSGGVVNLSSGFGLTYLPSFASYAGTKHFISGMSRALRAELSGTGVTVTQVCPGPVKTEFEENLGNFTGQKVPGFFEITAAQCARATVNGFERGRAIVITGFMMKLLVIANALTPDFIYRPIAAMLGRVARRAQTKAAPSQLKAGS